MIEIKPWNVQRVYRTWILPASSWWHPQSLQGLGLKIVRKNKTSYYSSARNVQLNKWRNYYLWSLTLFRAQHLSIYINGNTHSYVNDNIVTNQCYLVYLDFFLLYLCKLSINSAHRENVYLYIQNCKGIIMMHLLLSIVSYYHVATSARPSWFAPGRWAPWWKYILYWYSHKRI